MERENLISVRNVNKSYKDKKVNSNICFTVQKNTICCLVGANGSGKTTLLKQLVGVEKSDSGEILINNVNINKDKSIISKNLSYQSQNVSNIFRGLKVKEAIYFTGILRGLSKKEARKQTYELTDKFKIDFLQDKLLGWLSGGERQIVSICITLIGYSPILIFDEPSNNMDIERKCILIEELTRLKKEENKTVVMISHDMTDFESIVDKLVIFYKGRILLEESCDRFYKEYNEKVKIIIKDKFENSVKFREDFSKDYDIKKSGDNYFFMLNRDNLDGILNIYKDNYLEKFSLELSNITLQDKFIKYINDIEEVKDNE